MTRDANVQTQRKAIGKAILLFNDECAVCRRIAHWVRRSAERDPGGSSLVVQAIGDDPEALRAQNAKLDIWDAYETIHILMPDASMKLGGEAVAEVLRRLPNCKWFAWTFAVKVFGMRPFQLVLDLGYTILSDARPLLGCESCGIPSPWLKFVSSMLGRGRRKGDETAPPRRSPHFTPKRAHVATSVARGAA
jgi:predicted DCC family thiol-disulfide oxidoreductase YuxK